MRLEPIMDPEGDRILERERIDRDLEKASHPSTWDPPRPCPLCKVTPKLWRGMYVCPCDLPIGVDR